MQLVVIRHGIAVERSHSDDEIHSDEKRPLTDKGHRRMKSAARGLKRLVPSFSLLATSPLTRALQTAEIVARQYRGLEPQLVDELTPSAPRGRLLEWLAAHQLDDTVGIIGHEDGLSTFVSWLISARPESHLVLKKGGACLVQLPGQVEPGAATLEWLLTSRQLQRLA